MLAVPNRFVISIPRSVTALPLLMERLRVNVKPVTFKPVMPSFPAFWISFEVRLRWVTPLRLIPDPVVPVMVPPDPLPPTVAVSAPLPVTVKLPLVLVNTIPLVPPLAPTLVSEIYNGVLLVLRLISTATLLVVLTLPLVAVLV